MPAFNFASLRGDIVGGLVSSAVAIPLALGFGMFAFVTLGDEYFASGAVAGLVSAFVVGMVCVGSASVLRWCLRRASRRRSSSARCSIRCCIPTAPRTPSVSAALAVFFTIMLAGGVIQALFGLMRLGTFIKFTPHPVMAGFQNMAAALLFLVQIGNVLGFDNSIGFMHVHWLSWLGAAAERLVAALTFAVTWRARKISANVPPLLVGLGVGHAVLLFARLLAGFRDRAGSGHWRADRQRV